MCSLLGVFNRERNEVSPLFHDRLAELYLSMTLSARKRGVTVSLFCAEKSWNLLSGRPFTLQNHGRAHTRKLLQFIDSTHYYGVDLCTGLYLRRWFDFAPSWLLSWLNGELTLDLFEARAILLGRLGRHDQALELYAYRLQDYLKAEE